MVLFVATLGRDGNSRFRVKRGAIQRNEFESESVHCVDCFRGRLVQVLFDFVVRLLVRRHACESRFYVASPVHATVFSRVYFTIFGMMSHIMLIHHNK